jgi:hypothetical protein
MKKSKKKRVCLNSYYCRSIASIKSFSNKVTPARKSKCRLEIESSYLAKIMKKL